MRVELRGSYALSTLAVIHGVRMASIIAMALWSVSSPAHAAAPADDDLYLHPLLSDEALDVLVDFGHLAPEQLLPMLDVFTSISIDEDGVETIQTGARLADVEIDLSVLPAEEPFQDGPVVDPAVEALLEGAGASDAVIELSVVLRSDEWDAGPPVAVQEQWAMLEGTVLTWGDHRRFRQEALAARTAAGFAAVEPLLVAIEALGGEVLHVAGFTAQANILLPVSSLPSLLDEPILAGIDLVTAGSHDAGYAWTVTGTDINGYEAEDLLQSTQFYDRGYSGEDTIGQIESGADSIYNNHPGLKDSAGVKRVANCFWMDPTCLWIYPASGDSHATAVASVLVGDITAGQDTSISSAGTARRERSGVARTSDITGAVPGSWMADALDIFTSGSYPVDLVSMSYSWNSTDTTCAGTGTLNTNADAMFEAGVAFFKSAGNNGNRTSTNCTIGAPGSAIGVFPVGAYYIDSSDAEVIYDSSATSGSSRGGVSAAEGRERTIVGLAGPGLWQYPYAYSATLLDGSGNPLVYGTDWPGTGASGPENFCCTSSSTPAVAGSASLFRDWFHSVFGTGVDDPGILYANMLLMGDRTQETGSRMTLDYDELWGAGKLRLRAFDGTGLDGPASWSTGSTCVANGATVSVDVGSSVLSSDVEVIRAVAWWYDGRFHDSVDHDNINMRLTYDSGGSTVIVAIGNSEDNRQRIHRVPTVSGVQYQIKLVGDDVTADDEGCGTNSMRVFYAYFTEDSDREEAEDLDYIREE